MLVKYVITIIMFFPNIADYERGNILNVTHYKGKVVDFDSQSKCFSYVTKHIDELVAFAKNSYKDTQGSQVAEIICMPKSVEEIDT